MPWPKRAKKRRKVSVSIDLPTSLHSNSLASNSDKNNGTSTVVSDSNSNLNEIGQLVLVELQKDDPDKVLNALKRISEITNNDTTNSSSSGSGSDEAEVSKLENIKKDMMGLGAPAIIVLAMKKWPRHERIQAWCCQCLLDVVQTQEGRHAFVVSGGLEALVMALRNFPSSLHYQKYGLGVLMIVFSDLSTELVGQKASLFVEEWDGLQLIQKSMSKYRKTATIQLWGCFIYECLATGNKGFRKALIQAGAVVQVGLALQHHPNNKKIMNLGKEFMKTMSED